MSKIVMAEGADPGAAASGKVHIFAQTDGLMYSEDDAGTKRLMSVGNSSGVVAAANGGTGQSSYTTGDILYASGAAALSKLAGGTDTYPLCANGAGAAPGYEQLQTGGIANDAVDDTKVGNRVPQLYRRQGGDATNWNTAGTTTRTPTTVRIQTGSIAMTIAAAASAEVTVTFPTAFSVVPLIAGLVRYSEAGTNQAKADLSVHSLSTTQVTIKALPVDGVAFSDTNDMHIFWTAIGTE
jgi:hypothetical protein